MSGIKEIAQMTGLSIATVSHVINHTRQVSQKSRELVEKAIEEIGYKPNRAARMLRTQCSKTVAMVIPRVKPGMSTNVFFMDVLSGAKDYLQTKGYNLIVSTYSEEESDNLDDLRDLEILKQQWIDGILIVPNKKKHSLLMEVAESGIPFVVLDRLVADIPCLCVYCDTTSVAEQAVELLYRCNKRRIGYVGGSINSFTGYDRFNGYCAGLSAMGMKLDEDLVHTAEEHTVAAGAEGAKKLIQNGADAIFVSNDVQSVGALKYLQRANIRIPEQVGIIGFDDYEWMEVCNPPLTTVRQNPHLMGQEGARALLHRIEEPEYTEYIVLDAEIVKRRSHGVEQGEEGKGENL